MATSRAPAANARICRDGESCGREYQSHAGIYFECWKNQNSSQVFTTWKTCHASEIKTKGKHSIMQHSLWSWSTVLSICWGFKLFHVLIQINERHSLNRIGCWICYSETYSGNTGSCFDILSLSKQLPLGSLFVQVSLLELRMFLSLGSMFPCKSACKKFIQFRPPTVLGYCHGWTKPRDFWCLSNFVTLCFGAWCACNAATLSQNQHTRHFEPLPCREALELSPGQSFETKRLDDKNNLQSTTQNHPGNRFNMI